MSNHRQDAPAASAGGGEWGSLSGIERARRLFALARVVEREAAALARTESEASGRSRRVCAESEVPSLIASLFHFAGWADKVRWALPGAEARPVGEVALAAADGAAPSRVWRSAAAALAGGNRVAIGASMTHGATTHRIAALARDCGIGTDAIALAADPAGLADVATARGVVRALAIGPRERLSPWLAALRKTFPDVGEEPVVEAVAIVFADAPLDDAADAIAQQGWGDGGGPLGHGLRVFVEEAIAGALVRRLAAERVRVAGRWREPGASDRQRPLDEAQAIAFAAQRRSTMAEGSNGEDAADLWEPCLVQDVPPAAEVMRASIAGPMITLTTFRTPAEAVALIGGIARGGASIWAGDGAVAMELARRLDTPAAWARGDGRTAAFGPHDGARALLAWMEWP